MVVFAAIGYNAFRDADDDAGLELSDGEKLGLVLGGPAMIVGVATAYHFHFQAAEEHGAANQQYNEGLARQLNVCVEGLFVRPCEGAAAPPGMQPPGMQPPANPPLRLGGS